MKALYFNTFGDNSVLQYGEVALPKITKNQILVETKYIGLNFADIYRRRGTYHIENHMPYINGYEGLGRVVQVGENVRNFRLDEQVLFVDVPLAEAQYVCVPEQNAIKVPAILDPKMVAAIGLQGLTADFLAHDLGNNQKDANIFIHGISGGVGQILAQMLTADGINVYGTTSTKEKQQLALKQGAKKVFLRKSAWQTTNKASFDTVYDGVGSTLKQSLELTVNKGKVVFYGMAGGNPELINPLDLLESSKSILTGDLWDYLDSATEREKRSRRLFKYFEMNQIKISEPTLFSLAEGKDAYEYLESGRSIGKVLLVP
ncbi:zinc-binding dehydrogenase [Ligilactobacillus sp. WILCCON 0076]|uniref:Zinc-binding dehydrogenase n=1 Tax=Ligilactobacillus ubinensis TaxID=2876789 RepID=A0A9X2JM98_9LACO|nr:zinc-binding dehydrogenase [Ligilactobacillus ubinensis]MCP0887862.1 zinc-binding dehydrogenase [Ligilactobacillus ubinensis]